MAQIEELGKPMQREIIVIPIIDTSGSMNMVVDGKSRIGSVNEAMAEVPAQLAQINDDSIDSKLLIAPLEFATGARWFALSNNQPAEVESFRWIDMQANGLTDLGAAFKLLAEKLTVEEKGGWMKGRGGVAPVLILISDGDPTDDYKSQLKILQQRGWFKAALKFAVAVSGANKDVLAEFTGNMEAVIDTEVIRMSLSSIIKTVVVSSANSQSSNSQGLSSSSNTVVKDSGPDVDIQAQNEAIKLVNDSLTINDDDLFD